MNECGQMVSAAWQTAITQRPSNSRTSTISSRRMRTKQRFLRAGVIFSTTSTARSNLSYARLLEKKKKTYAEYRRSREEMRELLAAKANVDRLLNMEAEHDAEKEKDRDQR